MPQHEYGEGQRWTFKNSFEEFENTLVIEGMIRLSFFHPGTPDKYNIRIRCSNAQIAIHSTSSVSLSVTADALDRAVLELIETDAPIERSMGGMTGDDIEPLLRHWLLAERARERGRELASQAPTINEVKAGLQP